MYQVLTSECQRFFRRSFVRFNTFQITFHTQRRHDAKRVSFFSSGAANNAEKEREREGGDGGGTGDETTSINYFALLFKLNCGQLLRGDCRLARHFDMHDDDDDACDVVIVRLKLNTYTHYIV